MEKRGKSDETVEVMMREEVEVEDIQETKVKIGVLMEGKAEHGD